MSNRIKDFLDEAPDDDFGRWLEKVTGNVQFTKFYILEGHKPVVCSIKKWEGWLMQAIRDGSRIVRQDSVNKDILVSTVFLGLDHQWSPGGRPLLFETLVFNGLKRDTMRRYATWDEAEAGHKIVLGEVLSTQ